MDSSYSRIYNTTNFPWADSNEYIAQSIAWALDNATQMSNQTSDGKDIIVASMASGTTWTATNIKSDKTSITGTKEWIDDHDDLFTTRPEAGIKLQLYRMKEDGSERTASGEPVPINADPKTGNWPSYTWSNLEKYYADTVGGETVQKEYLYTVVEEPIEDYTTSYSDNGEGLNSGTITVRNKLIPTKTNITVTKVFAPDGDNKPEQILVDLYSINTPLGQESEAAEYTGQNVALSASNNWTYTFTNLPTRSETGYLTYTVVERTSALEAAGFHYTVTYSDNGEGVSEGTITITNAKTGKVQVTKAFSGVDQLPETFQITNSYNDDVFTGSSAGRTGTGTATDPYVWTIEDVPIGTEVTFTEVGATVEGYNVTITANGVAKESGSTTASANATVIDNDENPATASFVNDYEEDSGSVKVKKDFAGIPNDKLPSKFKITATWGEAPNITTKDLTVTGTQPEGVTMTGSFPNYTWEINDLPIDTVVTFTETGYDVDGYSVVVNGSATAAEVTATAAATAGEASFVNTYTPKAHVEAEKVFTNGTISENQFSFTISAETGTPLPETTTVYAGTDGKVVFGDMSYPASLFNNVTAGDDGKKTIQFTYTVKEELPEGVSAQNPIQNGIRYDTTPQTVEITAVLDPATGAITVNPTTATVSTKFTNEQLGKIQIEKTFSGNVPETEYESQKANLKFTVAGTDYNHTFTYGTNDAANNATWSDGVLTITNLPLGQTFTVTESGDVFVDGNNVAYIHTSTMKAGEIAATGVTSSKDGNKLTIENKYDKAKLEITKTVSGLPAEGTTATFTFTITGEGLATDGIVRTLTYPTDFTDGSGKITMTHADGIKPGATYTVTEAVSGANVTGYTRTTRVASTDFAQDSETAPFGTVTTDSTSGDGSISITNIYEQKTVEISVNKTWAFADGTTITKVEGKDWPKDVTVHVALYSKTGENGRQDSGSHSG